MSKIYFYPDISYQDIKHIEKAHSVLNDKLLINRAVNVIYEKIINLINKTDSILFVCGPGNNGLDALITANKLASDNYKVEVFITDKLKTAIDINDYKRCNIVESLRDISSYKFIIDGIFGYGLNRTLSQHYINIITSINESDAYIISIDVPSGLNCETGTPMPVSIKSHHLISLLNIKRGLFTNHGRDMWSEISHHNLIDHDNQTKNFLITANEKLFINRSLINPRIISREERHSQHKKSNGISCIVAGQQPYHGALILAAKGCIDTGAKYIHVYTEMEYSYTLPLLIPEIIANSFSIKAYSDAIHSYKNILIGPGTTTISEEYVSVALENIDYVDSIIIDAGALKYIDKSKSYSDKLIITPHPGEAAELLNMNVSDVQYDRYTAVQNLYDIYKCIVVLKGSGTIIYDGKSFYTCMDGNYKMASAGTGDILSGIILSESSFNNCNIEACIKSVTYHSYSSDILLNESLNNNFRPSMIPDKYSELITNEK
jgi:NAD(P)H-hydrate epimerase